MTLRVIGAGLPRTGTASLKATLEQLLGAPCYHMFEMFERADDHGPRWAAALGGDLDQLDVILHGWTAAVDWPASIFWRELAERHPDALVVLSHRGDADTWWTSADATVWEVMRQRERGDDEGIRVFNRMMRERAGFPPDLDDADGAKARYAEHGAEVVETISAERLLLWQPSDGFAPLCERLGLPLPDAPAIHTNTRTEFTARMGTTSGE